MRGYDRATYGERIADIYDQHVEELGIDDPATVATLAEYAGSSRVLELGVGTGRVAIPLASRGIDVHGIDVSDAMLQRMKAKPGGDRVTAIAGDFRDVPVDGTFSLYCVFNTFFSLTSQEEQVECFRNVGERLAPGGHFILEVFVPDLARFERGQRISVRQLSADRIHLDLAVHDAVNQRVHAQSVRVSEDGLKLYPVELRYAWPAELDLMASLASLDLRERWGGWRREPFTAGSKTHVSLYQKPAR